MHRGFSFTIEVNNGNVSTPGVDLGGRTTLVHRQGRYAVLRTAAGSHWSGIGSRSAHPSSWVLVKIERESRSATQSLSGEAWSRDRATVIAEEHPGAKWRATRARMIALCELAKCPCGGFIQDGAFVHAETCQRDPVTSR